MKPTLLPTLALTGSITTRVSILQGSQLPTLVPKVPTVNGTAMPTLIPAVSTIELPASMKHFNSTNGLQELSSLYPDIDWSSLPTYSILSDHLSLTSAAQDLPTVPTLPTSVPSIESTQVLDALPSSFVTEIPGFTFSGPDGVIFHPPVINYDPEKPLDEIIINIRGHQNCTSNCTSAPGPVQNLTTNGEGPTSNGNFTTPRAAQVPQPTKFCHPEHCHNGHCHEKHCHKQSEVDKLRKADPDWIWSPTSADDDKSQRLADGVHAFSPLTMITLPRLTATPLAALQNTSAAAQVVDTLESTVEPLQCKSRGHHRHDHHSRGHHSHHHQHHHHNTRTWTSRPVALRSVVPPRFPPVPVNIKNSATAAPSLPSSALLTTTTATLSPPLSLARRQLAAAPSVDGDSSGGIENLVQSLMSTSTLSFDPSAAWWPATHKSPDPVLTPSRASSTTIPTPTTTPKAPSSAPAPPSGVSPTAQVVFTTFLSSHTSTPAFSPPTLVITLNRRGAMSSPSPATATPALRLPRAQRLQHQLNEELQPEQAQMEQAQKRKGPKHCHGLHCPATRTVKASASAKHASRSTSSAAASSTTPCRLIGGHRMGRRL